MQWTLQAAPALITLIPLVLGGVLAVGIWIVRRRGDFRLGGRLGVLAVVGGLLPVLAYCANAIVATTPLAAGYVVMLGIQEAQFVSPLAAGLLAVVVLSIRGPRRPVESAAGIARRTSLTFVPAGWVVTLIAFAVITIALSVAAGLASSPDSAGRYTWFTVPAGTAGAGTTIYGWFFSLPALVLLLLLLATAWVALALIAHPRLGGAREYEIAVRRTRCRNTAAIATAAVAFHLGAILASLAGTSRLAVTVPSQSAGDVTVQTSFAALTPALYISSVAISCLAVVLCLSVVLTALPQRARPRQVIGQAEAHATS